MNLKWLGDLAAFYYVQRVRGFEPPSSPHMDPETIEVFTDFLDKASLYVEFGTGGSTVMAGRLGREVISVECDRFYAETVRRTLGPVAQVKIIDVDIGLTCQWGRPLFTKASQERVARWSRYSTAPYDELGKLGRVPNFVLVDGRFRRACAMASAAHAAEYGKSIDILIDDYFDGTNKRGRYSEVERFLGIPRKIGRSALFQFTSKGPPEKPTKADIMEASADFS